MTNENNFDFKKIENNWKDKWYKDNLYEAVDFSDKPKKYILTEFPYPSGKSMHMGHMMRYTVPEIYSRYLRMKGYNVLFPMGWDAFGLPAENYAIKTGTHPSVQTEELAGYYRNSMKDMGYGIDWGREINTTDPAYYKWTQWIFLKFFEEGLAEMKEEPVWWSQDMGTVLAEEEVIKDEDGNLISERGGYPVERKLFKQWVLKIPQYADKLIAGLDEIDFPESIKAAQKNWIGRKEGVNIHFKIDGSDEALSCFTTTPVNWGATFIVVAPEHPVLEKITTEDQKGEVEAYVKKSMSRTELDRMSDTKAKTGVFTGAYAINHVNGEKIPVWVADFVLMNFGTGIVQGCPAHDERDFEFATKFSLPIVRVVEGKDGETSKNIDKVDQIKAGGGETRPMVNSDFLDGIPFDEAMQKTMDYYVKEGWGERVVSYSIRDWIFSRQRYWGEPFPLIHKEDGTVEATVHTEIAQEVEKGLPLELPEVPDYTPSKDGSSPLARNEEWVNTVDSDGKPAKRETNTMPNWAGSCWYYLRYTDPKNDKALADNEKMKYWLPVDQYFGGSEHTTLHLLYSRFWHKFLYDQGVVPTSEPYQWRMNGGVMLGPDGKQMSKSKGNVIEPQAKLEKYGADAVRMYVAFLGPYDGTFPYNEASLKVCNKLVKDIYSLRTKVGKGDDIELEKKLHRMIKALGTMAENLKMNTAVSAFMVFVRELKGVDVIPTDIWRDFIKVIAPFAVFTAEELWQELNGYKKWDKSNSVHLQQWPEYKEELTIDDEIEIPVQINGKVRGKIVISQDSDEASVRKVIENDEKLSEQLSGGIVKFIYVPGRIVNLITK